MSASKGIALMWLRDQDAQELEKPVELSLHEKREEAEVFAKFFKAEIAVGKTPRQAMDEWDARQAKAKAKTRPKRNGCLLRGE